MAWLSPVGRRPVGLSRSLAASRACPRLDWWRGLSEGGNDSGVTPRRTHYHVLGLTEQASSEEIKQAYYRLSKLYHPDRNQADPESMAKFHEVTQAHDILGHAALRRQYDKGTLGQHTSVADLERASHTYEGQRFYDTRSVYQKRFGMTKDGDRQSRSQLDGATQSSRHFNFQKKHGKIRSQFRVSSSPLLSREDSNQMMRGLGYTVAAGLMGVFIIHRCFS